MLTLLTRAVVPVVVGIILLAASPLRSDINALEQLGERLFFDANLSMPNGMSCGSCHHAEAAFSDSTHQAVSKGVLPKNRLGRRNAPSLAYAMFSPRLRFDSVRGYIGGQFWDGRAVDLVDQAKRPFLDKLEMHGPIKRNVILDILNGPNGQAFIAAFGHNAQYIRGHIDEAYDFMATAIAAFETTAPFRQFSSKYDYFLAGNDVLSEQEKRGLALFEARDKGNCVACHPSRPSANGTPPLFTRFTYINLGLPRNMENPFYTLPDAFNKEGEYNTDLGLGETVNSAAENGKFKIPTLRNVELTAPYMHSGVFKTLHEVVQFYNTRDLGGFGPPEVSQNMNTQIGNMGLTDDEVNDIVAFMLTLTDGYEPPGSASGLMVAAHLPTQATLRQNFPNPFNPTTNISFALPSAGNVRLTIYNVLGQTVANLVDGSMEAGEHTITFDGASLASGVYFYRLVTPEYTAAKRMVLVK